ncbi:MAG: hypothetical protein U0W40_11765 [Acidimicrobiia bacterium]
MSSGRSDANIATPIAAIRRKTGIASHNVARRSFGIATPATTNGSANTGRATIDAVLSTDCAVSAVAAYAVSNPASWSIVVCSAVPVAPPPGVMRLNALPASCVLITENQSWVPSATACTNHTQANDPTAKATAGRSHSGSTSPSRS